MYLIDGPISKKTYFTTVEKEAISALQKNKKMDGEEMFWAYHKWIIEDLKYPDKPWATIWKKLTRSQKTIFVLGLFISQTNNGGVWQFLFNQPEYSGVAFEAFQAVSPMLLWRYRHAYEEFVIMVNNDDFWPLKENFNDETIPFDERWAAFKSGAAHVPSAKEIDDSFYKTEFKQRFYERINTYIEQNLGKVLDIKSKDEKMVIKKKDAIPHFTEHLKTVYGVAPDEVGIYYSGRVTIESTPTHLFLMKFKMPDGYESLGITGYFTHQFSDLPFAEVKSMHQKHHKQELVNFFHGWYLVSNALAKKPKANQLDPKKWEKILAKIQDPRNSQIPVNIECLEFMRVGKADYYIYAGDLYYNDPKNPLEKYEIMDVDSESFRGETNLLFFKSNPRARDFGGRSSRKAPITGKYPLFGCVGRDNKLLKDNPWGF